MPALSCPRCCERVKTEEGDPGDILARGKDAENTTLLVRFVVQQAP